MTPVDVALKIDEIVSGLSERERESALSMVWFFHVGRKMDWRAEWQKRKPRKKRLTPRA